MLLDELCEVCGYSRKHAIKLMTGSLKKASGKRGRKAIYGAAELAVVKPIWLAANQPCGKLDRPNPRMDQDGAEGTGGVRRKKLTRPVISIDFKCPGALRRRDVARHLTAFMRLGVDLALPPASIPILVPFRGRPSLAACP